MHVLETLMSERKQHNYAQPVAELLERRQDHLRPGSVHQVQVAHDSWCLIFKGGPCSCNPVVTLIDRTGSAVANRRNKR
jgi:hypothetical protein